MPLSRIYQVVFGAASPVFEAMVENEHKEGIEGRADIDLDHQVDVDLDIDIGHDEEEICLFLKGRHQS